MKALTAQVMVDDIEVEEEGIADSVLNETMATTARPGTSFKNPTVLQSLALGAQRYVSEDINFYFSAHV